MRVDNAGLMALFGTLAVLIGAIGVYGVMASVVARELGVRVALGATRGQIVTGVLGQACRYLVLRLFIGLGTARWVAKGFASVLFEVRRPTDGGVYAIAGVLIVSGLAAAWIPARRAGRVDPLVALRAG